MKKKGLTAGELLVTMTIIGVIAVLVIPGLVNNYHKNLYSSKIKKVYGTFMSAMERACSDNNVTYFNQTPSVKVDDTASAQKNFLETYFNLNDDATDYFAASYTSLDTAADDSEISVSPAKIRLSGGEAISFKCIEAEKCNVIIDINSIDKPNVAGRDLFSFSIYTTTNSVIIDDKSKCLTSKTGVGCIEKLLDKNWTMDY